MFDIKLNELFKKVGSKYIVLKIGGELIEQREYLHELIECTGCLFQAGFKPVLVHGGGGEISNEILRRGIKPKFTDGLRVTDSETMKITEMVLSGHINKKIVTDFGLYGLYAVGLSGCDGNLFIAEKNSHSKHDYGFVGEIRNINPKVIDTLISSGFIPVISPVSNDAAGNRLNVNADHAAFLLAEALTAYSLFLITGTGGVYNGQQEIIPILAINEINEFTKNGVISAGMLPKTALAERVLKKGVGSVFIAGCSKNQILWCLLGGQYESTQIVL